MSTPIIIHGPHKRLLLIAFVLGFAAGGYVTVLYHFFEATAR